MKHLFVLVVWLMATSVVMARNDIPSDSTGASNQTEPSLAGFVAPATRQDDTKELTQLVLAVEAVEDKWTRMTPAYREKIAKAALKASIATGVDATLLIAVARHESDFQGLQSMSPRCRDPRYATCQADCGVTQHHIYGSRRWVIKQCRQLALDFDESFLLSAKEIRHHIDWCQKNAKWQQPLQRCVLGRYNAGPYYPTPLRCDQRYADCRQYCPKVDWTHADLDTKQRQYTQQQVCLNRCFVVQRKCRLRANYWIGVMCWEYGARHQLKVTRSCRAVWSLAAIPTHYPSAATPAASR